MQNSDYGFNFAGMNTKKGPGPLLGGTGTQMLDRLINPTADEQTLSHPFHSSGLQAPTLGATQTHDYQFVSHQHEDFNTFNQS